MVKFKSDLFSSSIFAFILIDFLTLLPLGVFSARALVRIRIAEKVYNFTEFFDNDTDVNNASGRGHKEDVTMSTRSIVPVNSTSNRNRMVVGMGRGEPFFKNNYNNVTHA